MLDTLIFFYTFIPKNSDLIDITIWIWLLGFFFGKWLTHWFGLAYLPNNTIGECFVELLSDAPSDEKLMKFADYINIWIL